MLLAGIVSSQRPAAAGAITAPFVEMRKVKLRAVEWFSKVDSSWRRRFEPWRLDCVLTRWCSEKPGDDSRRDHRLTG